MLCSNVSQRRAAIILRVDKKTVERRVRFFGKIARQEFEKYWENQEKIGVFYFDDLETIEHTKCKPLSVTIAISHRREVMGIEVSSTPAKGKLAKISRAKYGKRKDERKMGIKNLLRSVQDKSIIDPLIHSDEHPFYSPEVKKFFPHAIHLQTKGGRSSSVAGQGELKKLKFDPLFTLNHSFAMFRANVNRLIRKTWCTTKDPARLLDHLYLYANFHNQVLVAA